MTNIDWDAERRKREGGDSTTLSIAADSSVEHMQNNNIATSGKDNKHCSASFDDGRNNDEVIAGSGRKKRGRPRKTEGSSTNAEEKKSYKRTPKSTAVVKDVLDGEKGGHKVHANTSSDKAATSARSTKRGQVSEAWQNIPSKKQKRSKQSPQSDSEESYQPNAHDDDDDSDVEMKNKSKKKSSQGEKKKEKPQNNYIQSFEQRLQQCHAFKATNGHLNIPPLHASSVNDSNYGLGTWANGMRTKFHKFISGDYDDTAKGIGKGKGRLGKGVISNKLEMLEEIGFVFENNGGGSAVDVAESSKDASVAGSKDASSSTFATSPSNPPQSSSSPLNGAIWNWRMEQCRQFKAEAGHLNIPSNHKILGPWAERMRPLYFRRLEENNGKKKSPKLKKQQHLEEDEQHGLSSTEKGKIIALEMMEFAFDGAFDVNLQKLQEYKKETGHCKVPCKYEPDTALGSWAEMVRREHNRLNRGEGDDYLTADRMRKLSTVGFVFSTKRETPWEVRFEQLRAYREEHGRDPPNSHPVLGQWVSSQRKYYNQKMDGVKNSLTDDRQSQLESIGFVFQAGARPSAEARALQIAGKKKTWDGRLEEFIQWKVS